MKRILLSLGAILLSGMTLTACGGSSGGGFFASAVSASLETAVRADLSGQQSAFQGKLGSGTTFTFPAVKGQSYLIQIATTDRDDEVTFDVIGADGSGLRSKSVDAGGGFLYVHKSKTQHVLVGCRPRNPFNTDIEVVSITVQGIGNFADDRVHLNFVVAGKFTGFGAFNDLATAADRGQLTDQVMAKVKQLYGNVGITISYEGFSYSGDQVRAKNAGLLAPDDQTVCTSNAQMASTGFETIQGQGLDEWAKLGFPENDPDFNRGHGINVFLVHHFSETGTVGLSPRPGNLVGNGEDSALCVAAFLKDGNRLVPRTPDQIATVLAHEIGHFLGLLHTTTFTPNTISPTGAVDDGIADTPTCTVLKDTNKDGRVGLGDGCEDESNLMFYQTGNQTLLTPGQTKVMKVMLSVQEH